MARLFEQVRRSPDTYYPSFLNSLGRVESVFREENGLPRWIIHFQDNERAMIGRSASCEVSFPDEVQYVSRYHCTVYVEDGKLYICDHSSNGTFFIDADHCKHHLVNETVEVQGGEYIILGDRNGPLLRLMKMKKEADNFPIQVVEAVFLTDVILQDKRW